MKEKVCWKVEISLQKKESFAVGLMRIFNKLLGRNIKRLTALRLRLWYDEPSNRHKNLETKHFEFKGDEHVLFWKIIQ